MPARGRPPGAKSKPWQEAIDRVARELDPETKIKLLDKAARAVVNAAIAGDMTAAKELGDRLDGKPHQTTDTHVTTERMVVQAPDVAKDAEDWAQKHEPKVH